MYRTFNPMPTEFSLALESLVLADCIAACISGGHVEFSSNGVSSVVYSAP